MVLLFLNLASKYLDFKNYYVLEKNLFTAPPSTPIGISMLYNICFILKKWFNPFQLVNARDVMKKEAHREKTVLTTLDSDISKQIVQTTSVTPTPHSANDEHRTQAYYEDTDSNKKNRKMLTMVHCLKQQLN